MDKEAEELLQMIDYRNLMFNTGVEADREYLKIMDKVSKYLLNIKGLGYTECWVDVVNNNDRMQS